MSLGQNFHVATPTPLNFQFVSDANEKNYLCTKEREEKPMQYFL